MRDFKYFLAFLFIALFLLFFLEADAVSIGAVLLITLFYIIWQGKKRVKSKEK